MGPRHTLRKQGNSVNGGDWPGAVRESIHAVESVARQLAPVVLQITQSLGIGFIGRQAAGYTLLSESAIDKLYGYTSDEEGIRHPLIENATSPVGQDEAVFMLGACASFASYLWRRHQSWQLIGGTWQLRPPPSLPVCALAGRLAIWM